MVTIILTKPARSLSAKGDIILQDGHRFCVIEDPQVIVDEVRVTTLNMGSSMKEVLRYDLDSKVIIQTHHPEEHHSEVF